MSELSHKEAYRLIHQRQLTAEHRRALLAHLSNCEPCRRHAALDSLLGRHLVISPQSQRPSSAQSAVFMARVKRQNRSQKIMKPVYALAGAAAVIILVLAGWFIMRPNLETISIASPESLVEAVEVNDTADVKRLLEAGASPNAVDSAGDPVLKTAIRSAGTSGSTEIIDLLLESGADVNAQDSAGDALLPLAASDGQLEVVQLLLDAGADVDGLTSAGNGTDETGLTEAAVNNHVEIAELLIAHGADVNHADSSMGITVLLAAALENNPEIITILLEGGADPNLQCCPGFGGGPLHAAAEGGSVEAVQALLEGRADVDILDDFGETPLMSAIISGPSTSLAKMVEVLLDAGADPNIQDVNGNSALHHAAKLVGKEDAVPILLENGASPDLKNNQGQTALDVATGDRIIDLLHPAEINRTLIEAVAAGDTAEVKLLLKAGASPDAIDSAGDPILKTAIRAAEISGSIEILALLVESGADVNVQDRKGDALLPQAARNGQLEVVQLLLDAGADVDGRISDGRGTNDTGLARAAINNHIEIAELLIAHGANVNHAESGFGYTVLLDAAYFNNPDIITILIENGADPNLQCCPGLGGAPLHAAAATGAVEAAQALLDGGADVDLQTELGETPLLDAIREGPSTSLAEMAAVLLDADADPNLQDINGNSALHDAAKFGKEDTVPILLAYGASLDLQNNNGETVVDLAKNDKIIELLREAGAAE